MKTEEKNLIKKDESGNYYFETLPENTRVAKLDDFYAWSDVLEEKLLILEKPFLIHSFKDGRFKGCRTNENFPYPNSDFELFLFADRVYVFDF